MTNKDTGKYGEDIAKNFLIKNGYEILKTNFRYSRQAEIDIIAQKSRVIHFIEVKTRNSLDFGNPLEAITKTKLMSIYKCARYYINQSNTRYKKMQIDAIGILLNSKQEAKIQFIEDIPLN